MKSLIVGYGSMGRRRIRLLTQIDDDMEFICVDSNPERIIQAEQAGVKGYSTLDEGINECPDFAFVCTSPGYHANIILNLVNAGLNVFTELNLTSDKYDEIMAAARENNVIVFISSTLLYKRQIDIIDSLVKQQKKPVMYIYHVGQYLPDWHPWESYKDFFAGHRETNGVREIFAIQMPWIVNAFGKVTGLQVLSQHCTELDIDFPDSITVSIKHDTGNIGVFTADVVSRKAVTRLEVIGENLHLFWDGHNDDLFKLNLDTKELEQIKVYESDEHVEGYSDNIAEQPYREELIDFLAVVKGEGISRYSLEQDKYVLSVIDRIEGFNKK